MLKFFGFHPEPINETVLYHAGKQYESQLLESGRTSKNLDMVMDVYDVDISQGQNTKDWIHTVEVMNKKGSVPRAIAAAAAAAG